jgi:hypothetical protein
MPLAFESRRTITAMAHPLSLANRGNGAGLLL